MALDKQSPDHGSTTRGPDGRPYHIPWRARGFRAKGQIVSFFKVVVVLTGSVLMSSVAAAQWFDQQSIGATVLIEKQDGAAIVPHGTGFLLWNYASPDSPIVVTCAHLLKRNRIFVRVNADTSLLGTIPKGAADSITVGGRTWQIVGGTLRTEVILASLGSAAFATDTQRDIAVFVLAMGGTFQINGEASIARVADIVNIPASAVRKRREISLGDELYFTGFPFGIGVGPRLEPLIRSGSVAWQSPGSYEFLVDALSYGGNSGSPVFSKAIFGRTPGEAKWDAPYLVGMVTGHVGEEVGGVLIQPDPKKLTFERELVANNVGLVRCVWIDDILRLVRKVRGPMEPFDKR